jgi:cytochrome d ubiquinol oxidase subunit II
VSVAGLLALILGISLTAYALFAGGDFGAGILDLLAGRLAPERAAIETAIGPLWEANHVWLIFAITVLFSAFPPAFSALGTALLAPLTVALVAIVLRGGALGLRASLEDSTRSHAFLSRLFGAASVVAPFAFGLVAGGVAVASRVAGGRAGGVPSIPWTGTFAIVVGALAVCLCIQLAASFVAVRLATAGETRLLMGFRRRGLQGGAGVLALGLAALGVAASTSPALLDRLTGAALPLVLLGVAAATLSLVALAVHLYRLARAASLLTGTALVWGWLVAQSPNLIGARLTIHTASATAPALTAVAIACGVVLLGVLPALYLLFVMFARPRPEVTQ